MPFSGPAVARHLGRNVHVNEQRELVFDLEELRGAGGERALAILSFNSGLVL